MIRNDRLYKIDVDQQQPIDIQQIIDGEVTYGGGGGSFAFGSGNNSIGAGSISVGGGSNVILTNTPNTPISNQNLILNVTSNEPGAYIYIDDVNTYKTTNDKIQLSLQDLLIGGQKKIKVSKDGFSTLDEYLISIYFNPDANIGFDLNLGSSILGGMSGGSGISGLGIYQSLPSFDINQIPYSGTPYYRFKITHYKNSFEQTFSQSTDGLENLNFELSAIKQEPVLTSDVKIIKVNLDGPDGSVSLLVNGAEQTIKSGLNNIAINLGDSLSIATSNLNSYRIKGIELSDDTQQKVIQAQNLFESVSTKVDVNSEKLNLIISSEPATVDTRIIPSISLANTENIKYNINTKTDIPVRMIKDSLGVTGVKLSIANEVYRFNDIGNTNSFVLLVPSKSITKIGTYRCILVPFNAAGDGQPVEFAINVVDEVFVGVPDIRNIAYPSLIKGPDFKGADIDFTISYESVNTDYVRIYKEGSSSYIKATSSGGVNLNFLKLLQLDSTKTSENEDLISINLELVPYNEQGKEVVVGKKETITIKLDKGDITIPRDVAVSRIADGFISQFDDSIFEDETSKYLTHFLHLGNGNNKIITTWTGSLGSLILKLYEPLDNNIQPNQQVWVSKLQANPIIETVTITGFEEGYCAPLKGPNFSIEPDNGFGFQIYSDLVASGSTTSTDLITKYLSTNGIDTEKLNISYVSGSTYMFENFSNFGSAEERINNFFYKIQLLETYKTKYEELVSDTFIPPYAGFDGGLLTENGYQQITEDGLFDIQWEVFQYKGTNQKNEGKKYYDLINQIIVSFDGYEKWLYKSTDSLAYPKTAYTHPLSGLTTYILKPTTDNDVVAWYESLVDLSYEYDKENPNTLINNIPEFIREDYNNEDFIVFLNMVGHHFDILWVYINAIKNSKVLEEKQVNGISNELIKNILQSFGWDTKVAFNTQFLWEYAFGTDKDGFPKYSMSLQEANNQVWRRILNNLPYILKHKGTARAMKAIMACYGVPQSMLTIMEFGGPQDPTKGESSKFTFDDRTAAIVLEPSSSITIPWHSVASTGLYPQGIEFRIKPNGVKDTRIISSSQFNLDILQTTGSYATLQFSIGDVSVGAGGYFDEPFDSASISTYYISYISGEPYALGPETVTGSLEFPLSTENYSNILLNKHTYGSTTQYEILLATSDGNRLTNYVSMSLLSQGNVWESGSTLSVGNTFDGNLDEFRLWKVPLQPSKFENHSLFPDAINGNSYTASTSDLLFRLDFEYPKDRTADNNIKNVSISEEYGENYGYAVNFYSASTYPYQYESYDRTVTATVPSLGLSYSNKIRFEEQTLIGDLSYKARATKKSFDRAPIDSNRLGLFFSPTKELNMDILKTFGDFNIDNYIGDFSDEYRNGYKELDTLRRYYFERLQNRDIYEYINLIKYIDRSLFDVLKDLAPARAKVSKGLLIEPHYLERSKTRWDRPTAENDYKETFISVSDTNKIESQLDNTETLIDTHEYVSFENTISNNEAVINSDTIYSLQAENDSHEVTISDNLLAQFQTEIPMYDVSIQVPTGSSITGEVNAASLTQIGMNKNSLANLGYGLYAVNGNGIVRNWEGVFGNCEITGSRSSVFLVKEQKIKKVSTQVSGYPTSSGQIKYEDKTVTYDQYSVSIQPFSGSVSLGNGVVEVTPLTGYFKTHYKYVNNNSLGMQYSYWMGSQQTALTTPDGLSPVETFTTNPNILKVAKTGRGSGEPILEVD